MKSGIQSMSEGINNLKDSCDLENYHITLSVIDDTEPVEGATVLLSYFDGKIMIDSVNDPE